ncbi:NERD domain-containing protein [Kineosporia sp. J2-2]|uniref:NERD domain-containing protein n=1 Tax=Kineosporia corallincola TaxID=2835133 RepID=A0ABS5TCI5_9ACTN|nr:nuclease-related domain-containing protein [Kineosporia corallincola]MBT0768795.1 NERD domain-containing protein [Kineosporia corallincola]
MRLRYPGDCHRCGTPLPAGAEATLDRATRLLVCTPCRSGDRAATVVPDISPGVQPGQAGASARREYERRRRSRERQVRQAHPRLGGLILAFSDDPQSVRAWATGAEGEELLGRRLDQHTGPLLRVLHDRRIPGSRANLDHLAVTPAGVFVIDAKNYTGRVHVRTSSHRPGGTRNLFVGKRNCTRLVTSMHIQTQVLRGNLHSHGIGVPVTGVLCFVHAAWPFLRSAFTVDGVRVHRPGRAIRALHRSGPLIEEDIRRTYETLGRIFPPA